MSTTYNIISMNEPGLFQINTETSAYIVHIATANMYDKNEVLLELCRAIVNLERQGAIVCSVQEMHPDGHRPRVAFRQSKQYKMAKNECPAAIIETSYVTHWSSGACFRSACKVNLSTHEVFDIQNAGYASDDDDCVGEYVVIDDVEEIVYNIDEIAELSTEDFAEQLMDIKTNGLYWTSFDGRKLDEEISKNKTSH